MECRLEAEVDSQTKIVVHELSHAVTSRGAIAHGDGTCKKLAEDDPSEAITNADNWGYDSLLIRLYTRFFDRYPDAEGQQNYHKHLSADNYTVRDIVCEMVGSREYYDKLGKRSQAKGTTIRGLLFGEVFNERPTPTEHPTEDELKNLNPQQWHDLVTKMVRGEGYGRRFGDH